MGVYLQKKEKKKDMRRLAATQPKTQQATLNYDVLDETRI